MFSSIRITVEKRLSNESLIDKYGFEVEPLCGAVQDDQEFIVENLQMPEGFCAWAWADIQRDVVTLALGGNFPWVKDEGVGISCCTDGFRPVIFRLERLADVKE
jgi:uncharacterized repeat protein (TIGR04076 family)